MTATTAINQPVNTRPTQERSTTNPTVWNQHFTFTAYIQAIRVQVQIGYGNHLCAWLDYRDAELLDLPPACTLATTPVACLNWVRRHVPKGWERDWLEAYYIRLDSELHWQEVRRLGDLEAERVATRAAEDKAWQQSEAFKRLQWQRLMLDMMKSA